MKLDRHFYTRTDVVQVARDLLGKVLVTHLNDTLTSGVISETEAYAGENDRASHAFGGKRTPRNAMMYSKGGVAYVYLCYGIHHLFNVVTNEADVPHAVLVRAIRPLDGHHIMAERRAPSMPTTGGPGTLTQAMGIRLDHNGTDLLGEGIWIEERDLHIPYDAIIAGPRVGVEYAGTDALLPYRFRLPPSQPTSK